MGSSSEFRLWIIFFVRYLTLLSRKLQVVIWIEMWRTSKTDCTFCKKNNRLHYLWGCVLRLGAFMLEPACNFNLDFRRISEMALNRPFGLTRRYYQRCSWLLGLYRLSDFGFQLRQILNLAIFRKSDHVLVFFKLPAGFTDLADANATACSTFSQLRIKLYDLSSGIFALF